MEDYSEEELRRRYGKNWREILRRLWKREHEDQDRKRRERIIREEVENQRNRENGHHEK